jgi:hypothetical protein
MDKRVNLFDIKNYRIKRKLDQAIPNPLAELISNFKDTFEYYGNKKFKNVNVDYEIKCDILKFEGLNNDKVVNVSLINPFINVNLHVNNNNISILPNQNQSSSKSMLVGVVDKDKKALMDEGNQISKEIESKLVLESKKKQLVLSSNSVSDKNIKNFSIFGQNNKSENIEPNSLFGNNSSNLFGAQGSKNPPNFSLFNNIPIKQDPKPEEKKKEEVKSILEPIPNIRINKDININTNHIQLNPPRPNQIQQNQPINEPVVPISENLVVPDLSNAKQFQNKIIKMSENYNKIKVEIDTIYRNESNKRGITMMKDAINQKLNQMSTDNEVPHLTNLAIDMLLSFEQSGKEDLYLYTVDYICKTLIIKSEGYRTEKKSLIYRLGKVVSVLDQKIPIFGDYFISILTFRCPFVIPKIFSRRECRDDEEYSKKMGFAYKEQNSTEHLGDMECHSYLFFSFLELDRNKKYSKYVENFLQNLFTESCIYPMAGVVNGFIDAMGQSIRQNYQSLYDQFMIKIVDYIKLLETAKNGCKSSGIKSRVDTSIHFIKKNILTLKRNQPTEMFK